MYIIPQMYPAAKLTVSFSLLFFLSLSAASSARPTAYEILERCDFPVGLLPNGVTGYEFNEDSGEFKVHLSQTCKFHIESYQLEYKSTITGVLSKDRITHLKGVSVKVLILWLNIVEIVKEDDELQFSVGIASANFPVDGFEESPTCGCGFDCNGMAEKEGIHRLISSS